MPLFIMFAHKIKNLKNKQHEDGITIWMPFILTIPNNTQ